MVSSPILRPAFEVLYGGIEMSAAQNAAGFRALPASLDAERCVLASLICGTNNHGIALALSPSEFFSPGHRLIYKVIQKRQAAGESIDVIAVMNELGSEIEAVGGGAYLGELLNGMYVGPDVGSCVAIIREKAFLREIASLGESAWRANGDAAQILEHLRMLSARIEMRFGQGAKPLPFRSANEAIEGTGDTVQWLVKGYVAAGAITLLSAKVKMGKTTLVARLIESILTGREFINAQTRRTPVVYLTEQPPASFRVALERANLTAEQDFRLLHFKDTIGIPWSTVASGAAQECKRLGAKLLVVDTLAQFAGLSGDSENDSGAILEAIRPLQEIAGMEVGVFILYHDRKSGGDVADATRGSSALPGAADIVLSLRRPEGNGRKSLRVLQSLSRFSETPEELVIELTDQGYVALGEKSDVALQEATKGLLACIPTSETHALILDDLCSEAGIKRATAQRALAALVSGGDIQRIGEGKRGNPFRFFVTEGVSAQTSSTDRQKETNRDWPFRESGSSP
jgi:hypothetical protein